MSDEEFQAFLDDAKKISADIRWKSDDDHPCCVEFLVPLENSFDWILNVRGSYNPLAKALTFAILSQGTGRIYALDLGKDHRNPDSEEKLGRKHKHRWSVRYKDKWAYVPADITESVGNVRGVWAQFCIEAGIAHVGTFNDPVPVQEEMLL